MGIVFIASKFIFHAESMGASELDLSPPYVVLGPACDQPTYFTASLSSRYLKDIQISYSATTPLLSDTNRFPLFYRTVPSYSDYSRAIFALMRHFDWLRVGVVHQEDSHYTRSLEDLNLFLTSSSANSSGGQASVILSQALNSFLTRSVEVSSNARIFIVMAPENMAANTICTAYKTGMIGENFQWILLGDFQEDWWRIKATPQDGGGGREAGKVKCTDEEMLNATESIMIITYFHPLTSKLAKLKDDSTLNFWQEFASFVNTSEDLEDPFRAELATRAEPAYNAVWVIARALDVVLSGNSSSNNNTLDTIQDLGYNPVLTRRDFSFFQGRPVTDFTRRLNAALENTDIVGQTGKLQFNSTVHSKHQPITYISQMQAGKMVPVGVYDADGLDLTRFDNELVWLGDMPPLDRPIEQLQVVSLWLMCMVMIIAFIGVVFAVCIVIVNFIYRKHKVIKASSPYLNLVIVLGCIMGFLSIFFMTTENLRFYVEINMTAFPYFCNARLWLLTIGFTLAFGALFAKTWRIYVIFRNPWRRKRPYKDHILLGMVAVLLSFDLVILILWAIIDPLVLVTSTAVDLENFVKRQYSYCISQYTPNSNLSFIVWLCVVIVPKTLLLAFGIFLVVQTSRIKAKFFRDAKFTGMAIFGFVMVCGVGVPIALITMFQFVEELGFVAAASTILICSYLILVMVFIPKFILLRRYKKTIPSAILLGLNPSFRIRRNNQIRANTYDGLGFRTRDHHRALRRANDSVVSQISDSFTTSDELFSPTRGSPDEEGRIGWESAFEDSLNEEFEVQETRLTFDDFEYIVNVALPRKPSTDTVVSVLSEEGDGRGSPYFSYNTEGFDGPNGVIVHSSPSRMRRSTCETIAEEDPFEENLPSVSTPPYSNSTSSCSNSIPAWSNSVSAHLNSIPAPSRTGPQIRASTLEGHRGRRHDDVDYRRAMFVKTKTRSLTVIPAPIPPAPISKP